MVGGMEKQETGDRRPATGNRQCGPGRSGVIHGATLNRKQARGKREMGYLQRNANRLPVAGCRFPVSCSS